MLNPDFQRSMTLFTGLTELNVDRSDLLKVGMDENYGISLSVSQLGQRLIVMFYDFISSYKVTYLCSSFIWSSKQSFLAAFSSLSHCITAILYLFKIFLTVISPDHNYFCCSP